MQSLRESLDIRIQRWKDSGDMHSNTGTTSNTDCKSTIFSRSNPDSANSPCSTIPPDSRAQSPVRCQTTTMNRGSRRVGHVIESPTPECPKAISPGHIEPSQPYWINAATYDTLDASRHDASPPGASRLDKSGTAMDYQEDPAPTPQKAPSVELGRDLEAIGLMFQGLSTPISFKTYRSSSTPEGPNEDDIDLETSADDSLSKWFMISLSQLSRPFPVICAAEQFKKECASILQDEGFLSDDQDSEQLSEDDDRDSQCSQIDPCDNEEGSRSRTTGSYRPQASTPGTSKSNEKKRLNNGQLKSSSSSEQYVKTKSTDKRCRDTGLRLSCPYRKRNPIRFNVRDHQICANQSHVDMASLKKHVRWKHFKSNSDRNTCPRCRQPVKANELFSHLTRCTEPPPSPQMIPQQDDPEDGIDERIESQLTSRDSDQKVGDWKVMYKILFPEDQIIPEPDFEPVVEDYEAFEEFERRQLSMNNDFQGLMSRYGSKLSNEERSCLAAGCIELIQNNLEGILRSPGLAIRDLQMLPSHGGSHKKKRRSLESDFVHVPTEVNEGQDDLFGSSFVEVSGSTLECVPTDTTKGKGQSVPQAALHNLQNNTLSAYHPDSQPKASAGDQEYPADGFNYQRLEPQPIFQHMGTSAIGEGSFNQSMSPDYWLRRPQEEGQVSLSYRPAMSLPDNNPAPTMDNIETAQDLSWISNIEYPSDPHSTNEPWDPLALFCGTSNFDSPH
ncbi:hypothetical protein F5B20DRAFT_544063 [Whalleya microplaca]|nr:hypothetical protein F5B20DRAFT_544063 [Whalleya microplaca]